MCRKKGCFKLVQNFESYGLIEEGKMIAFYIGAMLIESGQLRNDY